MNACRRRRRCTQHPRLLWRSHQQFHCRVCVAKFTSGFGLPNLAPAERTGRSDKDGKLEPITRTSFLIGLPSSANPKQLLTSGASTADPGFLDGAVGCSSSSCTGRQLAFFPPVPFLSSLIRSKGRRALARLNTTHCSGTQFLFFSPSFVH
ncbi:hypothetical protein VTI28DRAFT_10346 [Corynascus sepedonium]